MMNLLNLLIVGINSILQIPMADAFRSSGKIYVVLGVMLILLLGIFYFLWKIDRKIKKLENENRKGE
mgnify:CR=1 FL=1